MLGLALSIPVYGFSKFELINFLYKNKEKMFNTILLYNKLNQFYRCHFDNKKIQISSPELIELNDNKKLFKIKDNEQIIADNNQIYNFFDLNSGAKKHSNIAIFNFNIDVLIYLSEKFIQKKFIPRPLYVKNFY